MDRNKQGKEFIVTGERALFTVEEFVRDVVPMSRSTLYSEIRAGRLQTVTIGRRRYIPASKVPEFITALADRKGGPDATG